MAIRRVDAATAPKHAVNAEQATRIIMEHNEGRAAAKIAKELGVPVRAAETIISEFKAKVPKVTEGELAVANQVAAMWRYGQMTPFNPSELVTRKGLEIFDKMRQDDQIKAALAFKKLSCLSTGWEIAPPETEEDDPDDEITIFIEYVLKNIEGSLSEVIYNIMTGLDYGYSVSEKVYKLIEEGEHKNMIGLRAIKTRQPHLLDFETDEFGNLKPNGLVQTAPGVAEKRLPVEKFMIFVHQKEFDNWYGRSDLEAAYRAWWIKENAYRWLSMLLERFGIPPIFALYNPNKMTPAQIAALVNVVQKIQAATAGALPRPSAEDLELWSPELAGQTERVFIPAIEMFNKDIARALLMPDLLGVTVDQGAGSLARAQVHFDVFMLMVEYLRTQVSDTVINSQLVKPLVDLNFGKQDLYPTFRFLPFTDEVKADLLNTWQAMVTGGIVHRQDEDEEHIRALMKFPELNKETMEDLPPLPGTPEDPNNPANQPPGADPNDPNAPSEKDPSLGPDGKPLPKEEMDAKGIPATAHFFDPDQPRNEDGEWTDGGRGSDKSKKDDKGATHEKQVGKLGTKKARAKLGDLSKSGDAKIEAGGVPEDEVFDLGRIAQGAGRLAAKGGDDKSVWQSISTDAVKEVQRLRNAYAKKHGKFFFDPNQPRDPAGTSTGGQWTSKDGGGDPGSSEFHPAFEGDDSALAKFMPNPEDRKRLLTDMATANAMPATININTPERQQLRYDVAKQVYEEGTQAVNLQRGHEAWIVVGLPGAGKNFAVADPLAQEHGAVMIDNDLIKEKLPEYGTGLGAASVHVEASEVIQPEVIRRAVENGDNIVMPRVGKSYGPLKDDIEMLKKAGYKVNLVHVKVDEDKAIRRAVGRYLKRGRLVSVSYMKGVDGHPAKSYARAKAEGVADGYQEWDNNGDNVPAVRTE